MKETPNIVLFLVDDLGYGDVSCLNINSRVNTEHIDRLAREGICFTDAHACSSVCTPSRYGVLTGRYNWRSSLKRGVISGISPPLLEPGRMTLGSMLQNQGYHTAAVGKWHLGMDWRVEEGVRMPRSMGEMDSALYEKIDYAAPIENGPLTRGFHYFYGTSASLDLAPYVFIENDRVTHLPDRYVGLKGFEPIEPGAILDMEYGPCAPNFDFTGAVPHIHQKMLDMVELMAAGGNPFFLYGPSLAVHGPLLPTDEFKGKSGIGPYGDIILETDDFVGQMYRKLEELDVLDNTIFIVASDNGCAPIVDPQGLNQRTGHNPSHVFRGCKFDIWEGGHRIPLIVRWPNRIAAGTTSDQTVCLIDLFATIAEITGAQYGPETAEDSVSLLPLWLGEDRPVRDALVHHSGMGRFSLRRDNWKLELCAGSGGISIPTDEMEAARGAPEIQLYDLAQDIGERENLQDQYPELVAELRDLLDSYVDSGRSAPLRT